MIASIKGSASAYFKKPLYFAKMSLFYAIFQFLLLFSMFGVFLALVFAISLFGLSVQFFEYFLVSITLVLFIYLSAGAFGAYIRNINAVMNGQINGFSSFFKYGLARAPVFFGILVVKLIGETVLAAIPLAVLLSKNSPSLAALQSVPYVDSIALFLVLVAVFTADFLFFFAFISAAVYDTNTVDSVKNSFRVVRRGHVFALMLFALFFAIAITLLIPVIDIITLLVTLPIITGAMVLFVQKRLKK
jgi:hypothetical protein